MAYDRPVHRLTAPFAVLIGAARDGEGWAFERLFHDLAPAVHGYLRFQGAREPDDLTNEVLAGAFAGLAGFVGDERAFRSWVFTIAYRRLVDGRRRQSRRPLPGELGVETPAGAPGRSSGLSGGDVETEAMTNLAAERARDLLDSLPHDQRNVLLLRVVADLGIDEVASVLGKRPSAVKALQRRGLGGLRRKLGEEVLGQVVSR